MEKFLNKELVSFLKENKAYDAFTWSFTPQEDSYWADLNCKWKTESGE